jgi:phosphate transport system permease protein
VTAHGASVADGPPPVEIDLSQSGRRLGELVIKAVLGLAALISVLTTVGIVVSLLLPALEFFAEINPIDFFTGTDWSPLFEPGSFGAVPLLVGTLSVTFWALLVAIPAGLGSAIYLSEYASPKTRAALKPMLEILAGIPTVVYGYFALTAVTPLLRDIGIQVDIFNPLAGGLVVGVMLIPTVASLSEDAMASVPQALRDGAYGLGADRLQVSLRVVVPAAISGIIASFVLAVSRAVGETMIVLIAVGQLPQLTLDPRATVETLTAFIGATGNGDLPTGSIEYKTIFAVGLTLFVLTLIMNVVSIRLVRRYREVYD